MNKSKLLEAATTAAKNAYAPYSGYHVGAALLTEDKQIYSGCNLENAALGSTICAERVAIFKALTDGSSDFSAMALVADGERLPLPCGACLQVMSEFCDLDLDILIARTGARVPCKEFKFGDLLPHRFGTAGGDSQNSGIELKE